MVAILRDILSSQIRAEVFRLLFGLSDGELHVREIQRQSGLTIGTVQQELKKLTSLGLVESRRDGNRLYYRANKHHPIFREIHNLVIKTNGLADVLREALVDLDIVLAFVFGSVARDEITESSDINVFIVGDTSLRDVTRVLAGVPDQLGREVNPVVVSSAEFQERAKRGEHFVSRVIQSPRIFIVGNEDELGAMAK